MHSKHFWSLQMWGPTGPGIGYLNHVNIIICIFIIYSVPDTNDLYDRR